MDRRTFISLAGAAVLGAALGGCRRAPTPAPARPLGLQLYTVMDLLEKDFEGTIKAVAAIGYREVETLGDFGQDRRYLRELFEKYGLRSPSQHMMPAGLGKIFAAGVRGEISRQELEDGFLKALAFDRVEPLMEECIGQARDLGQQYVIWQIAWASQLQTRAAVDELIRTLNRAGELCAAAGLSFAFHNHGAEFVPVDGQVPYDLMLTNTNPAHVDFEMDVAWVTHAGVDPVHYLDKYPGRFKLCHLKDVDAEGKVTRAGTGVVRFPEFLAAAKRAGVAHAFVEYDAPADPLAVAKASYGYLQPLL